MIVADTSVWIEHLARREPNMPRLLAEGNILIHPFVIGEVALGSMPDWERVIGRFDGLPIVRKATDKTVIEMIRSRKLQGSGIGFVDAHLIASCLLEPDTYLWTRDRRLAGIAARLGVDATA